MNVTVVIPALNEVDAIASTIDAVKTTLESSEAREFEILIIDDGSTDGTPEIAKQSGARVISHPTNAGYGASLKNGIMQARFDTIVISDADGSYPIDRIPDLLESYNKGFDMVVGARSGSHYQESALKKPLRAILRKLVEYTANREIPDINSGLRVFSKEAVVPYFNQLCDTFSFTTSLTLAYFMTGKFVSYVPIDYHERIGRTKVRLFRDSVRTLQYIVEAATYYNPLKIFALLSIICVLMMVASFTLGIIFQVLSLFSLGVGAGLLSLVMLGVGLLAVLLKQIMNKQ